MCIYDLLIFALPALILFSKKIRECIQKKSALFIVLSFALFGVHGWIRAYKWQFVPLYLCHIIVLVNIMHTRINKKDVQVERGSIDKIVLACFILAILLSWAFPPSKNFWTTGPYSVGSEIMTISWSGSNEVAWQNIFGSFRNDAQNPMFIQLMFPLNGEMERPHPVVISHYGEGGFEHHYADFEKELASQGFIVVQVNETQRGRQNNFSKRISYPKEFEDQAVLGQSGSMDDACVLRIVDQLEKINQDKKSGALEGMFDLDRIVFIGEATSCFSAGEAAKKDSRIKAVIALDSPENIQQLKLFLESLPVSYLQFQYADGIDSSEKNLFVNENRSSEKDKWLVNIKLNKFRMGQACLRAKEHGAKVRIISTFCKCYLLDNEPKQALIDIIGRYSALTTSYSFSPIQ